MPDLNTIIERLEAINGRAGEIAAAMAADASHRERLRAKKLIRLPLVIGRASGSALSMGGVNAVPLQGPVEGFMWSVRNLIIEGMNSGATPDVINITRSDGRIIWQLNGNQFAQTWGRGEVVLRPGECLGYVSVGTFNSTNQIIAHGMADNIPAELAGEFF